MTAVHIILGVFSLALITLFGIFVYIMFLEIKDRKLDIKEKEKRLK